MVFTFWEEMRIGRDQAHGRGTIFQASHKFRQRKKIGDRLRVTFTRCYWFFFPILEKMDGERRRLLEDIMEKEKEFWGGGKKSFGFSLCLPILTSNLRLLFPPLEKIRPVSRSLVPWWRGHVFQYVKQEHFWRQHVALIPGPPLTAGISALSAVFGRFHPFGPLLPGGNSIFKTSRWSISTSGRSKWPESNRPTVQ